jgi:LmbE family N-acetylglucosaminyl deacetylase
VSGSSPQRIVVLSTHLDDAVLSLGAWIHRIAERGGDVRVLTVLGGRTDSTGPPGPWDRDGGFASEGAAAVGRRAEDEAACAFVGARPIVLPFGDMQYPRSGGDEQVWSEVRSRLDDADVLLVPGSPLLHPDHQWLARLAMTRPWPGRVGLYVEQPYCVLPQIRWWRWKWRPRLGPVLADVVAGPTEWTVLRSGFRDRIAKWRACRAYRTQLPLLSGAPPILWRIALYETLRGGEAIAWLRT